MTGIFRTFAILLLVACCTGPALSQSSGEDEIVSVPSDDREMNAAIARARELLPVFWETKNNPQPRQHSFALKVRITDGEAVEHFWLTDIANKDDGFVGTIDNQPRTVGNVEYRQRSAFPQTDISDWLYIQDGKFHGAFTLRAMLKHVPADEAAYWKEQLAFEPE